MSEFIMDFGRGLIEPFDELQEMKRERWSVAKKIGFGLIGGVIAVLSILGAMDAVKRIKEWREKRK